MTMYPAHPTAYADRFVEVGGLRLHYTEWNPDGADPVVLLHGLNVQCHTWDPIAAELAAGHRVLAFDLRGHGESDWSRAGYRIDDFVADLAGAVEALSLPPFHLVTHSLGCRIGIVYAGRYPERVLDLVLNDAGPEVPRKAAQYTANVVSRAGGSKRGFRTEAEAREFYADMHPEWRPEFLDLHARHQVRRNWAGKLVFRADPDLFWLTGSASSNDDPMVWAALDNVRAPTLILWGERSHFFDEDIAARMLERLDDGRLVRTDTGHYIPREAPEVFLAHVQEFFAQRGSRQTIETYV